MYEAALFFHLVGAFIFFAGIAVAAFGLEAARRRRRPAEIAAVFRVVRAGVPLVVVGAPFALAFGLWLVDLSGRSFTEAWIVLTVLLHLTASALAILGGQRPRAASRLAVRLAHQPDASADLRRLLDDRVTRSLNYLAGVAVVGILALAIRKPGV